MVFLGDFCLFNIIGALGSIDDDKARGFSNPIKSNEQYI